MAVVIIKEDVRRRSYGDTDSTEVGGRGEGMGQPKCRTLTREKVSVPFNHDHICFLTVTMWCMYGKGSLTLTKQ